MSVIHDALEKGVKTPVLQPYPILLPDTLSGLNRESVVPLGRLRDARRKFFVKPRYVILAAILFFIIGGAVFIASRFHDVPARDSSPKPQAAAVSGRLRTDVSPAKNKLTGTPVFNLTGVVEGAEPIALINDQAVRVGDRIERALVKEIQGRRVILEFKGTDIVLSLQEV